MYLKRPSLGPWERWNVATADGISAALHQKIFAARLEDGGTGAESRTNGSAEKFANA